MFDYLGNCAYLVGTSEQSAEWLEKLVLNLFIEPEVRHDLKMLQLQVIYYVYLQEESHSDFLNVLDRIS